MKLDHSLFHLRWNVALNKVLMETRKDLCPLLIVRGDDPQRVNRMRKNFKSKRGCMIIRLGYVYSLNRVYEEIYSFLSTKKLPCNPQAYQNIIKAIGHNIKKPDALNLIVIDNCHYIEPGELPNLIGFLYELQYRIQVVLILTEDNLGKWRLLKERKDPVIKYFFNLVRHRYALSV